MSWVVGSLRLRFFLLVWPLVVAALLLMGYMLGGWGVVELRKISSEMESVIHLDDATSDFVDSLSALERSNTEMMQAVIDRMVERDSILGAVVVASARRGLIASTITGLTTDEVTVGPGDRITVTQEMSDEFGRQEIRMATGGRLIDPPGSDDPRLVALLPMAGKAGLNIVKEGTTPSERLTQRVLVVLLIGSMVAALLTLLLAGRLTGRIEALALATKDLADGNLRARVSVEGHDEISTLAGSFNELAVSLEQSEQHRRQMVSDLAHELRTPLTNLIGLLEAGVDGIRPIDSELIQILSEEALLLNRLVDDLRDLALSDAGDLRLDLQEVDIATLVKRAVAGFDSRHGIALEVAEEPMRVIVDERRLGQVLRNLVQNAVTHSPNPQSVVVSAYRTDASIRIVVRDQGAGISPEDLERIWERFFRVDQSRNRSTGGMGLGLSVAKQLVEMMHGTISVRSELGEGTEFEVNFKSS